MLHVQWLFDFFSSKLNVTLEKSGKKIKEENTLIFK